MTDIRPIIIENDQDMPAEVLAELGIKNSRVGFSDLSRSPYGSNAFSHLYRY